MSNTTTNAALAQIIANAVVTALGAVDLGNLSTEAVEPKAKARKASKAKATPVVTGGPSFPEARAALLALKAEGKAPKGMTVREAIAADLLPALGTTAPAKGKKAKAGKAKKAEPTGPAFGDLRAKLVAHKAAGLIKAGVSVRQAQAEGLMDDEGNFTGGTPVEAPKAEQASKKGKKSKAPKAEQAEQVAVVVEADEPAKIKAHEAPRRANGTIAPKSEWALRETLAETGKFDRFEIDALVASA